MEERKDYAVLRFVDQNGWSYMVNDCVKGCSLMEYVKNGIQVEKSTVFEWIMQLVKQLEQYYRCGDENTAYGYINPYALIVNRERTLFLLDVNEPDNEEMLRQMNKKKVRMLFVRKERVLSQKTERSDDLYGIAKTMEFVAEKCLMSKAFTRKEERIWKRILGKCYGCGKNAMKVLKNVSRDMELLKDGRENSSEKISGKKILLAVLVVCVLSAVIIEGAMKKPETKAVAADQKESGEQSEESMIKETDEIPNLPYLELGLLYYGALEDYEDSLYSIGRENGKQELTRAYQVVIECLEKGDVQDEEGGRAEDAVRKILDELKSLEVKIQIQSKEYLYYYPLLKVSILEEDEEGWKMTRRIGEELLGRKAWYRWDTNGEKEIEIRNCLAESYWNLEERLKAAEQYEQIKEIESKEEELEETYEKLLLIYEEEQEYEKVWAISREAVEQLPESEKMWLNYLERYCENPEMNRELCAEAVKKALQAVPELPESEEFQKLQEKYKIVIEGENIRVGE